jgi:L-threonylcarbamoyladenylate synthase
MEQIKIKNIKNGLENREMKKILEVLGRGGVIASPTDTVYGFLADARNEKAADRIFEIKGRLKEKALPVFVASFKMLNEIAVIKNKKVLSFLKENWPGKITAVLPLRDSGGYICSFKGTIAVRMPDSALILKIIERFGGPITGTSANISGRPEHLKIKNLIKEFKKMSVKPDLVLNGGDLPESRPSTVVDLTGWPLKILRQGAVKVLKVLY